MPQSEKIVESAEIKAKLKPAAIGSVSILAILVSFWIAQIISPSHFSPMFAAAALLGASAFLSDIVGGAGVVIPSCFFALALWLPLSLGGVFSASWGTWARKRRLAPLWFLPLLPLWESANFVQFFYNWEWRADYGYVRMPMIGEPWWYDSFLLWFTASTLLLASVGFAGAWKTWRLSGGNGVRLYDKCAALWAFSLAFLTAVSFISYPSLGERLVSDLEKERVSLMDHSSKTESVARSSPRTIRVIFDGDCGDRSWNGEEMLLKTKTGTTRLFLSGESLDCDKRLRELKLTISTDVDVSK